MQRFFRFIWITGWYAFALAAVLTAITLSTARVLLPMAGDYNEQIQLQISELVGQPVRIDGLDAEWHGLGPKLVIKNVKLLSQEDGTTVARFDKAFLGFDLFSLLFKGQLGLNTIVISGMNLYIERFEDGSIAIGGISADPDSDMVDDTIVEDWILNQPKLKIEHTNVTWHDRKLKYRPVRLRNMEISLVNEGDSHRVSGKVILPAYMGKRLSFALDITGNPFQSSQGRNGTIYIKGENIRPDEFIVTKNTVKLQSDIELWSQWHTGKLNAMTARFNAHDVNISKGENSKAAYTLQNFSGLARWQRREEGWTIDVNDFTLKREGRSWPKTNLRITSDSMKPTSETAYTLQAGFLRIEDITDLIANLGTISDQHKNNMKNHQVSGELNNTLVVYLPEKKAKTGNKPALKLETAFNNLSFEPHGLVPGAKGLNGSVVMQNKNGTLALDMKSATAYLPKVFRQPIPLDRLKGIIQWHESDSGIVVTSRSLAVKNEDISATANIKLQIPHTKASPYLDVTAQFKNGRGKNVSRYIPYAITPAATVEWLDHAITDGNITSGAAVLHGRIEDFPFTAGEGKFQVTAYTKNTSLDYAPGWPRLKQASAILDFHGNSMHIKAQKGRIFNSDIHDTDVIIRDMGADVPVLEITGKISGPTSEKLDYLRVAPDLKKTFEKDLRDISVSGASELDLDIRIPFSDEIENEIRGKVSLANNNLRIKGRLGEIWRNLDGNILFSGENVSSEGLNGLFLSSPAKLNISTVSKNKRKITRFESTGTIRPAEVVQLYVPSWSKNLSGSTAWKVRLDIPHKQDNGPPVKPKLYINSMLENIRIDAPAPLNKKEDEEKQLSVIAVLSESKPAFQIQYGNNINSILHFGIDKDKMDIRRGVIHVNQPAVPEMPASGIKVVAKNMAPFSYDEWVRFISDTPEFRNTGNTDSGPLNWFSSIDTDIEKLQAFAQTYHHVNIKAINTGDTWQADINSDELTGRIELPVDLNAGPVRLDLEKLLVYPSADDTNTGSDPRGWPALVINSKRFGYDDTEYGNMRMSASKTNNGLRLDELELATEVNTINGSGYWNYNGKRHATHVKLASNSKNIGKTMASMGFADTVRNGEGTFEMDIHWPDTPDRMTFENITGTASLDIRSGQLLDISPGAGRIFGLLSLQTLPRRLFLDFRDVFAEGFSFDDIRGTFNISGGDAYTSDLQLEGPAARIAITGRTGLVDRDYDQLVTVVPDAAASVPMLTVLAGAEPFTALVTWTLKNIFQTQIDEAVSFQYTITGSWDSPKVVKIGQSEPAETGQLEDEEEDP